MKTISPCKICKTRDRNAQSDPRYRGWCDDCRMEKELENVIACMREDFPEVADYNVIDAAGQPYAEILDKDDKRIGVISERQLTRYWNIMEGG